MNSDSRDAVSKYRTLAENVLQIILYVLIIGIVLTVVISAGYSYLSEDDFSFEYGAINAAKQHNSSLLGALASIIGFAKAFQGSYLFNFLIHLIRPYDRWGMPGFHAMMILIALFFCYSVCYLVNSVHENKTIRLTYILMMLLAAFGMYGTLSDTELFLWYTGTLNYTLEFGLGLLAAGVLVRVIKGRYSEKFLILSSVLGMLGSWGGIELISVTCASLLMVVIICFKDVWRNKRLGIPFLCAFVAGILNISAPGYYKRLHGTTVEGHATVKDAFRDLFVCYKNEVEKLFSSPLFWIVLLVAFLICFLCYKETEYSISWLTIAAVIVFGTMARLLILFPVVWGDHTDSFTSARTAATYEMSARYFYLVEASFLGLFLKSLLGKIGEKVKASKIRLYASILILILTTIVGGICVKDNIKIDFEEGYAQCVIKDFKSGNLTNNYKVREYALAYLQNAPQGSDVLLSLKLYPTKSTYGMGITESTESEVNMFAAWLFDVNSVACFYEDVE